MGGGAWTRGRVLGAAAVAVAVFCAWGHVRRGREEAAARDPRLILGHVWFDHLPSSRMDEVWIGIWLGGGIGIYDHGSVYRSSIDLFEFERQGGRLSMKFLQDGA